MAKINQDKLADAFYDEDWDYFKKIFGKKPQSHEEAERMIEENSIKNEKRLSNKQALKQAIKYMMKH